MHSKIFQIGLMPIKEDEFVSPSGFYENSSDFADYIGEEFCGKDRLESIEYLAESLSELLDYKGDGILVYKGMGTFLTEWVNAIQDKADSLLTDNILQDVNLYRIKHLTDRTHKDLNYRFYLDEWNGWAGPASDLIEFLNTLKEGTLLYVGAVIDYHF